MAVSGRQLQGIDGQRAISGWRLDSGVRLLTAGPALRQLRWSTDPDAPAAHVLGQGEIRLSVQRVEARTADVWPAGMGADSHRCGSAAAWRMLTGTGVGVVVESKSSACPVGVIVRGPLPIGTYCVLRVTSADGHGLLASAALDPAAAPVRFAWCTGPLRSPAVTGMDAVEQALLALRDQGHTSSSVVPLSLAAADSSSVPMAPITDTSCLC